VTFGGSGAVEVPLVSVAVVPASGLLLTWSPEI